MADILIQGMHGLGDNLHQRAVVRHYMRLHRVWLETPHPQIYHDLVGSNLKLLRANTSLRAQAKNEARQAAAYSIGPPPNLKRTIPVWYEPAQVRAYGSFLGAMLCHTGAPATFTDFRLPVPKEWRERWWNASAQHVRGLIEEAFGFQALGEEASRCRPDKPIMVYCPLVERTEWGGCATRNPDAWAYGALAASLRERFFVVSIADTEPGKEWISGADIPADLKLHKGELDFETLTGLFAEASLVYSPSGFAIPLAQAAGTPSICVFGGHESSRTSYNLGARYAPYLPIDTINPCDCFEHNHACEKRIDYAAAQARVEAFVEKVLAPPAAAPA
jgi:hypothetical protein